jgi:hypothetical protein
MSKRRETCWRYSMNPDDKHDKNWYILAFTNGKGACRLRRFEAASGRFLSLDTKKGDFQDNFADWLNPVSFPLHLSHAPNLVEARKKGLPVQALFEIKKQVIQLATSSLLGILDP